MPKLTFYNLPEEKRELLMQSLKKEFSRVPLFEASISNIVKAAGIPRGSFYQYFEDKEDAFFFLLDELKEQKKYNFLILLRKHEGDLFNTAIDFYGRLLKEEEHFHFFKNAFLNMTQKVEDAFAKMISDNNSDSPHYKELILMINQDRLNIESEKELYHMIQIVTAIIFHNLVEAFAHELSEVTAMENLMMEIRLVKKGLCRP